MEYRIEKEDKAAAQAIVGVSYLKCKLFKLLSESFAQQIILGL